MSRLLPTRMVARPWGREQLPQPFHAPHGERIGEVWFEPVPQLPHLLVKYLFTSEALSVQVHPSNAQRPGHGKEECWLVLGAEPGAKVGIGFREEADGETIRAAALDGSIESLLDWYPVSAGDFFYIPAGTVHALGAGVVLVEVQQNSDTTYRLYDYGRPRELHLDDGVAVANGGPHPEACRKQVGARGTVTLADGPHFRVDRVVGPLSAELAARHSGPLLVLPLDEGVTVGGEPVGAGCCALAGSVAELAVPAATQLLIAQ